MFNITFLNPIILPALGAVSLPLLIHLLSRRKVKKLYFSSIVFLKELQKDRMRRLKLRQILLLVLRTLIILVAVLAFARPAFKGAFPQKVGAGTRTAAAVLLDNSYSIGFETDRGTLFELAKRKALDVIDLLKEGDELILLPFADQSLEHRKWEIENKKSVLSHFRSSISDFPLSNRATDVGRALERAVELLRESNNLNKELYLLTDLERNGWEGLGKRGSVPKLVGAGLKPAPTVYVIPVTGPQQDNLSVDRVTIPNQILSVGSPISIEAEITNHRESKVSDLLVHLYINGKRVRQSALNLEGGQTKSVLFQVIPEKAGSVSGWVEIEGDRLLVDNRRYFSLHIPERVRALLVGGQRSDTYFIRHALNPSGSEDASIQCTETSADRLSSKEVNLSDVIVLANVYRLSDWQLDGLQTYVHEGGGLLICLGPNVNISFYNQKLFPKLLSASDSPTDLHGAISLKRILGASQARGSYYSFGEINLDHPLLKDLPVGQISSPRFYLIYEASLSPQVDPIIRYSNGSVALGEGKKGKGKVILFTSAVDLDWTDLPIKGLFVPLFYRIIQYLATALPDEPYLVGDLLEFGSADLESPVEYEGPIGDRTALLPTNLPKGLSWQLDKLEFPGIWRLFARGKEVDRIAVNVDTRESDPEKIAIEKLREIFKGIPFKIIPEGAALKQEVFRSRYGRELWKHCLALALILMAAEMIVARTRKQAIAK